LQRIGVDDPAQKARALVHIGSPALSYEFMEAADKFTFEIQQARRFEKNFFLYQTNLPDALENVHNAQGIMEREGVNLKSVVGEASFEAMTSHLSRYEALLSQLQDHQLRNEPLPGSAYNEIEAQLREHGAEVVSVAEELVAKERRAVNSMLRMSYRIPVAFLIVFVLLVVYLAIFIAQQVLAPLSRMMAATRRIARGDFTPITPRRRYHDEFSELAIAINHMMEQLVHRHGLLVQAHKLQAVGTLTAGIAHELNNPLNNIMLTSEMLKEAQENPEKHRSLVVKVAGYNAQFIMLDKRLQDQIMARTEYRPSASFRG